MVIWSFNAFLKDLRCITITAQSHASIKKPSMVMSPASL